MLINVFRRLKHSTLAVALTAWLAVALVGSQIAGQIHRVEHVPAQAGQFSEDALSIHADDGDSSRHDCAAYDAAALGDGPPVAQSTFAAASLPRPVATAHFVAVADNSPNLPFHSRAPPRV